MAIRSETRNVVSFILFFIAIVAVILIFSLVALIFLPQTYLAVLLRHWGFHFFNRFKEDQEFANAVDRGFQVLIATWNGAITVVRVATALWNYIVPGLVQIIVWLRMWAGSLLVIAASQKRCEYTQDWCQVDADCPINIPANIDVPPGAENTCTRRLDLTVELEEIAASVRIPALDRFGSVQQLWCIYVRIARIRIRLFPVAATTFIKIVRMYVGIATEGVVEPALAFAEGMTADQWQRSADELGRQEDEAVRRQRARRHDIPPGDVPGPLPLDLDLGVFLTLNNSLLRCDLDERANCIEDSIVAGGRAGIRLWGSFWELVGKLGTAMLRFIVTFLVNILPFVLETVLEILEFIFGPGGFFWRTLITVAECGSAILDVLSNLCLTVKSIVNFVCAIVAVLDEFVGFVFDQLDILNIVAERVHATINILRTFDPSRFIFLNNGVITADVNSLFNSFLGLLEDVCNDVLPGFLDDVCDLFDFTISDIPVLRIPLGPFFSHLAPFEALQSFSLGDLLAVPLGLNLGDLTASSVCSTLLPFCTFPDPFAAILDFIDDNNLGKRGLPPAPQRIPLDPVCSGGEACVAAIAAVIAERLPARRSPEVCASANAALWLEPCLQGVARAFRWANPHNIAAQEVCEHVWRLWFPLVCSGPVGRDDAPAVLAKLTAVVARATCRHISGQSALCSTDKPTHCSRAWLGRAVRETTRATLVEARAAGGIGGGCEALWAPAKPTTVVPPVIPCLRAARPLFNITAQGYTNRTTEWAADQHADRWGRAAPMWEWRWCRAVVAAWQGVCANATVRRAANQIPRLREDVLLTAVTERFTARWITDPQSQCHVEHAAPLPADPNAVPPPARPPPATCEWTWENRTFTDVVVEAHDKWLPNLNRTVTLYSDKAVTATYQQRVLVCSGGDDGRQRDVLLADPESRGDAGVVAQRRRRQFGSIIDDLNEATRDVGEAFVNLGESFLRLQACLPDLEQNWEDAFTVGLFLLDATLEYRAKMSVPGPLDMLELITLLRSSGATFDDLEQWGEELVVFAEQFIADIDDLDCLFDPDFFLPNSVPTPLRKRGAPQWGPSVEYAAGRDDRHAPRTAGEARTLLDAFVGGLNHTVQRVLAEESARQDDGDAAEAAEVFMRVGRSLFFVEETETAPNATAAADECTFDPAVDSNPYKCCDVVREGLDADFYSFAAAEQCCTGFSMCTPDWASNLIITKPINITYWFTFTCEDKQWWYVYAPLKFVFDPAVESILESTSGPLHAIAELVLVGMLRLTHDIEGDDEWRIAATCFLLNIVYAYIFFLTFLGLLFLFGLIYFFWVRVDAADRLRRLENKNRPMKRMATRVPALSIVYFLIVAALWAHIFTSLATGDNRRNPGNVLIWFYIIPIYVAFMNMLFHGGGRPVDELTPKQDLIQVDSLMIALLVVGLAVVGAGWTTEVLDYMYALAGLSLGLFVVAIAWTAAAA